MNQSLPTRNTLLGRLVNQHDESSWEEFVHYYRQFIYIVIYRMNINHHDAEELTQEVLLKLWKNLPNFRYQPEKGKFRGWVCQITTNLVRNFVQRRKTYASKLDTLSVDKELLYLNHIELPEVDKIVQEEWEKYISVMAWNNIKQHFSEKVCEAFIMLRKGISRKEVAEKLGLAENSVSTYKARIISRMQVEIERLNDELTEI